MNNGFYEFSRGRQEITSSVFPYTGSAIISGSLTVIGSAVATSFTGSLQGTATQAVSASYSNNSTSASYSVSSSQSQNAISSSYSLSSSYAVSSSYSVSSSRAVTSSFAISASWAPTQTIDTSSLVTTSSFNAFTSSYNTGSFTGSFTGTLIGTSSWATNAATSYTPISVTGSTIYSTNPSTSNISSTSGIFLGSGAGQGAISANYAVHLGYLAGQGATNASETVFIGPSTGLEATKANGSIFLGSGAGSKAVSASYSTIIGYYAGSTENSLASIGSGNIIIGNNITLPTNTKNSINIGAIIFATGSYQTLGAGNLYSGSQSGIGRVGINKVTPEYTLDVSGSGNYSNGLTVTGSVVATSFTGSLFGTSSWAISSSYANNSISASYAVSSSQSQNATSSSYSVSSSYALSASYAATSSYSRNLQISGSINNVDYIDFNTGSTVTQPIPGRLSWNDTDGTLDIGLKGGNVTLQIGQETVARVVNKTGGNLLEADYHVVRVRSVAEGGAQGQRLAVVLAQADNDTNSATTLGLVTEDIAINQEGFITLSGQVRRIDTTGTLQGETWVDGDVLYLSPTTPGYLTNVKPQAPQHMVIMGYVEYAHSTQGKIFVKVDNGYEIDELHNVNIDTGSLTSGQLLVRSGSVWTNLNQLTGSYGLTGSLTATSFTGSLLGTASFAANGGVTQILAGTNVTISPTNGLGAVTINSVGGGSGAGANITGSFTDQSTWTFVHGLGNRGVVVQTFDTSWNQIIPQNIALTDSNTATITFPSLQSGFAIATLGGTTSIVNAVSASFATTASFVNTLNQNVIITGSLAIGTGSIGGGESNLVLGPAPAGGVGEGGQIGLLGTGGSYTSSSFIDTYQNQIRIIAGQGTASTTGILAIDLGTKNAVFQGAVTASAFNGLPNDYLYAIRSGSSQTVGSAWANTDVIFNSVSVSKGISFNTSTGVASLTGGKVYRVTARLAWSAAAAYNLQFSCYTSANTKIGPDVEIVQSSNGTSNISDGTLEFIYAPSTNTDIKIRCTGNNTALSGEQIRADLNTQFIIQQIA